MPETPAILGPDGKVVNTERVRLEKLTRFNPCAGLTPDVLGRQLVGYSRGELRALAWTMEWMERHDDTISSVAAKAKSAVSRYGWDVLAQDDLSAQEQEQAEAQVDVLRGFYHGLEACHAVDTDEVGGMRLLLAQVMDGYGKGYSTHHIVWRPEAGRGLRARLVHVPLWYFEAMEGRLRFLPNQWAWEGVEIDQLGGRDAWLISKGRGVMLSCAIAWMFKHIPIQDWLTYCDRHGMPGFVGKTAAAKGSDGWNAIRTAVASMGAEFGAVINQGDAIEVLDLTASGDIPYEKLVDRMDRAITILWRGGDLSTMSRGGSERAVGANPQDDAQDELDADNAMWAGETIDRQLSRQVLAYHFGPEVPQLANLVVRTRTKEDSNRKLEAVKAAVELGVPVGRAWFCEEFGIPAAGEAEEVLGTGRGSQPAPPPQAPREAPAPPQQRDDEERPDPPTPPTAANAAQPGAGYVESTLARALGVRARVLDPVRPLIEHLLELAEDGSVSDEDLLAFWEDAARSLPELFDPAMAEAMAEQLEAALGTAALQGARDGIRENADHLNP